MVARTWLQIKVELVGGLGGDFEPPPGRVFAVAPSGTFERFAEAIDRAFGRWDFSHLHAFELADGRRIGFPDEDFGEDGWIDHATARLGSTLEPGERFEFVFDFGDDWRHRCEVLQEKLDARGVRRGAARAGDLMGLGLAARPVRARDRRRPGLGVAEAALANHGAAEQHEGQMRLVVTFVADAQPARVVQVREGPLDDPPLAPQPGAVIGPAPGDHGLDAPFG